MSAKNSKQTKARPVKATGQVKINVKVKKMAPKTIEKSKVKEKPKAKNKVTVSKDKQTRIEILQVLAEKTNMTRVQVETVFDELNSIIAAHMSKRGSGEMIIPKTGIKLRRIKKKASKERRMVSPLTGQEVTIAAKPARFAVKLSALKPLKQLVAM